MKRPTNIKRFAAKSAFAIRYSAPAREGRNNMEIYLNEGQFIIGEYSIAGNYEDGYTVWKTEDGEDSDTLYDNQSFEACVVWCLNS